MPKAFSFDHSTVRRVKRFLAKENQSSTTTKERDRSHLGQMPILLVWKRKRVEFRERESYIFSLIFRSKKTLRRTHYTPHTQTTSVVLPPSKSHVSRPHHHCFIKVWPRSQLGQCKVCPSLTIAVFILSPSERNSLMRWKTRQTDSTS